MGVDYIRSAKQGEQQDTLLNLQSAMPIGNSRTWENIISTCEMMFEKSKERKKESRLYLRYRDEVG